MKEEVYRAAEIFKALGDPTRLKIIKILASKTASDIKVADMAEKLGISQPAVSQHLKILKNVGILNSNREGYRIIYNIDIEAFKMHKELIDSVFQLAFVKCEGDCEKKE